VGELMKGEKGNIGPKSEAALYACNGSSSRKTQENFGGINHHLTLGGEGKRHSLWGR